MSSTLAGARKVAFSRAVAEGRELEYLAQAVASGRLAGGGSFTRRCESWLQENLPAPRALLTHSCTAALEMAAILAEVGPGDEAIMPSFTFSSTANAFALRGATPVFVDIRPDTLNLDERLIEAAITPRTRVIVPVHYAGLPCAMDAIMAIAERHGLLVIEDAAQGHMVRHGGRALGTIGHLGCLSFHETKNLVAGEGGALLVNDARLMARAEILREKGTDRTRFLRGEVDKYTWQDIGSSFIPGELSGAFLLAQLEQAEAITQHRRALFDLYAEELAPLAAARRVTLPSFRGDEANGHIFWMLLRDGAERGDMMDHLRAQGVQAVFHYVPLHSAPAGRRLGRCAGALPVTEEVGARLLRLPLHGALDEADARRVAAAVRAFYGMS
ncbi:MAG TPA: dTDP-4-amino-4,6-dideoxygalactose transaminase [Acetobacteraceae bacterium]|nr:dTDP-4-amino-4,6-dideoxygalactose transaminase [Acetobacteraceae bacterium]